MGQFMPIEYDIRMVYPVPIMTREYVCGCVFEVHPGWDPCEVCPEHGLGKRIDQVMYRRKSDSEHVGWGGD